MRRSRRFWAVDGRDERSLIREFLAIQHYIHGDQERLEESLAHARSSITGVSRDMSRSSLLLDVLECNQLVRDEKFADAAKIYKRIIKREERAYRAAFRRRFSNRRSEDESYDRMVLAILHHNLAYCLDMDKEELGGVKANYRQAIGYRPAIPLIWNSLAEYYFKKGLWDDAAAAFRDSFVASTSWGDSKVLNANLAEVYIQKARSLKDRKERIFSTNPVNGSTTSIPEFKTQFVERKPRWLQLTKFERKQLHEEALGVLDEALSSLDWDGIEGRKAAVRYERGLVLKFLDRLEEAAGEYYKAADCYEEVNNFNWATYLGMEGGDLECKLGFLDEGAEAYELAIRLTSSITEDSLRRSREGSLLARFAILDLAENFLSRIFGDLIARWKVDDHRGLHGWGPYYDVLHEAKAILENTILRHPVSVYYHQRIREDTSLIDDRDLSSALLKLYKIEREKSEISKGDLRSAEDTATIKNFANVTTPLAIEINQHAINQVEDEGKLLKKYAVPMTNSILEQFGVRIPRIRMQENSDLLNGEYILMIHEVPIKRGKYDNDEIKQVFQNYEALISANLKEFIGHQEVQNYLERNLLVKPVLEDISEKENCLHMDPLSTVLRALVRERVPLMGAWKLSEGDIKDLASFAFKLKQGIDDLSIYIYKHLSEKTRQLLAHYKDSNQNPMIGTTLVIDLNEIIQGKGIYDKGRFRKVNFRSETLRMLEMDEHIRDSIVLNRLLLEDAYPEELAKGPITYPSAIYQVFRSGWKDSRSPAEIVENIRLIPQVRKRLWGNVGTYDYLFLPESFDLWIESCMQSAGKFQVLVIKPEPLDSIYAALADQLKTYDKPALVVRRQEHRATVYQLIAEEFPEIPVLSTKEMLPGKLQIITLPNFSAKKQAHT